VDHDVSLSRSAIQRWIRVTARERASERASVAENQRVAIKRAGRPEIRKRIFIIPSASGTCRPHAIRTQFNVSDEEKGSFYSLSKVIPRGIARCRWGEGISTVPFSPPPYPRVATLHYRIYAASYKKSSVNAYRNGVNREERREKGRDKEKQRKKERERERRKEKQRN